MMGGGGDSFQWILGVIELCVVVFSMRKNCMQPKVAECVGTIKSAEGENFKNCIKNKTKTVPKTIDNERALFSSVTPAASLQQ